MKLVKHIECQIKNQRWRGSRFGVPPSGGGTLANRMTSKNFKALYRATAPRAKAGTPNPRSSGFSRFLVPPAATMRIAGASKLARDRGTETPYRGCLERAHSEA